MAKKLKVEFPKKASETLKRNKIEHVLIEYPSHDGKKNDAFVVVLNKDINNAKAVILADSNAIIRVKGARKFEKMTKQHKYYKPMFECKCRQCGKIFKSAVKESVWCSKDCRHAHRIERMNAKTKTA